MATPVAHSLMGITLYILFNRSPLKLKEWGWIFFAAWVASLADFDFLLGLFTDDYSMYHRGVSHSIGICFIVSLILWAFFRKKCGFSSFKFFCFILVLYGSHLVIDFFTRDNWPPNGGPFLWPFSNEYYKSPIDLFLNADRSSWEKVFSWHNLRTLILEILIFGTLLYLFQKNEIKKSKQQCKNDVV